MKYRFLPEVVTEKIPDEDAVNIAGTRKELEKLRRNRNHDAVCNPALAMLRTGAEIVWVGTFALRGTSQHVAMTKELLQSGQTHLLNYQAITKTGTERRLYLRSIGYGWGGPVVKVRA